MQTIPKKDRVIFPSKEKLRNYPLKGRGRKGPPQGGFFLIILPQLNYNSTKWL